MNQIDPKKLHELMKIARQAVQGEEQPWAAVSYGVYLSKLIDSETIIPKPTDHKSYVQIPSPNAVDDKKENLAKKCNITKLELEKIVSVNNNTVEVTYPVQGNDAQKHIIGAQIALIASESILDLDWTPSSILIECLRGMGVKDLANVSLNLKKYSDLIRSRGTRGHKEYKLTSSIGRQSSYDLIRKLAKGEKLYEN